jgi:hypothetical protein
MSAAAAAAAIVFPLVSNIMSLLTCASVTIPASCFNLSAGMAYRRIPQPGILIVASQEV